MLKQYGLTIHHCPIRKSSLILSYDSFEEAKQGFMKSSVYGKINWEKYIEYNENKLQFVENDGMVSIFYNEERLGYIVKSL